MILSMTGYGKAVADYNEKKIHVEIKSLNSKQLDLSTRIAPIYREREMEMRQMVAAAVVRGKVDFCIWVEKEASADAAPINAPLLEAYYHQLKDIAARTGIPEPADWFYTLVRMPDITTRTEVEELTDEEWQDYIDGTWKIADRYKGTNLENLAGELTMALSNDIERVDKAWRGKK